MQLNIKNFQSIEEISIDINGFTVLQGASDIGKSAVRRAVNLIMANAWSTSNVRRGNKNAVVSIDDGVNKIVRTKGSDNSCEINGITYSKLGITVPEEYAKIGIRPFVTTDNEYNILVHSQLDPLFLLAMSPFDQHKIINSILGTSLYEDALRLCQKDLNAQQLLLNNNINQKTEIDISIDESKKEINLIETAIAFKDKMELIKQYFDAITAYQCQVSALSSLKKTHKSLDVYVSSAETIQAFFDATKKHEFSKKVAYTTNSAKKAMDTQINLLNYTTGLLKAVKLQEIIDQNTQELQIINKIVLIQEKATNLKQFVKLAKNNNEVNQSLLEKRNELEKINAMVILAEKIANVKKFLNSSKQEQNVTVMKNTVSAINRVGVLTAYLQVTSKFNQETQTITKYKAEIGDIDTQISKIQTSMPLICPTCNRPMEKK